jgi:LCP family protein required for cell wall assembly
MLSIPRDLWVNIPGIGENRINTAHFFAETQTPGSGPQATINTIKQNFNIKVDYYVRIRFEGVKDIVDAMGGVNINLAEPMAGYSAGIHHLTGNKALAFARDRQGTDDFFRMEHGQFLIKAIIDQLKKPSSLLVMPKVVLTTFQAIDTNLPWWQLPRFIVAIVRLGINGIDNRIISREMATPYITPQGARVLIPNWDMINPITKDIFGQ